MCFFSSSSYSPEPKQFLVSWVPFYWLGKCLVLALLFIPEGNISTVVFEKVVVLGMDNAHHVLNNLVVPNVVQFVVSLPWRLLMVLFPTHPSPSAGVNLSAPINSGRGKRKGLASRLQHLKKPMTTTTEGYGSGDAQNMNLNQQTAAAVTREKSLSPPPLPHRISAQTSPPVKPKGGDSPRTRSAAFASKNSKAGSNGSLSESSHAAVVKGPLSEVEAEAIAVATQGSEETAGDAGVEDSPGKNSSPLRRRSFGDVIRSALTGNSEVRVRDHLFDLNVASPAPPPIAEPPKLDPLPTVAAGSSKSRQERTNSNGKVALPALSSREDDMKRRGSREAGGLAESAASADPRARSKYATRRRPSDFSHKVPAGGGCSGDEAGGGLNDVSGMRVRRRSGSSGRKPVNTTSSRSTNALNRTANTRSTPPVVDTSASRAKRLEEWRKKRAKQTLSQHREEPRRSRVASADLGSGSLASVAGAGNANTSSSSKRFRHVERFRSEMARNVGSTEEVSDGSLARVPAPSPRLQVSRGSR